MKLKNIVVREKDDDNMSKSVVMKTNKSSNYGVINEIVFSNDFKFANLNQTKEREKCYRFWFE